MNRREFLAVPGLAVLGAAQERAAAPYRIDVQSHFCPPGYFGWIERREGSPSVRRQEGQVLVTVGKWQRRFLAKHFDLSAKIADMDAAGIEVAALSINDPGPELFGADGLQAARLANDGIAEAVAAHPSRLFGLCVLPLQDIAASISELKRAIDTLGLRGILLYSNLAGRFPDEPVFEPVFAQAEAMGVPILLHPAYPVTYEATHGYEMAAGLGLMFDTTIALCRIILSGLLERHPKLKLVCPHVGGSLPYLIGRIDHQTQVLKRGADHIKKPPSEYLRQVWLDTVTPLPLALKFAIDFMGPDRLLFATDHPWVDPQLGVKNLRGLGLPGSQERDIFRENARRLFGR